MLDAENLAKKLTDAMEHHMCKRCGHFNNGCIPLQIIACAQYFMALLDEMGGKKEGEQK